MNRKIKNKSLYAILLIIALAVLFIANNLIVIATEVRAATTQNWKTYNVGTVVYLRDGSKWYVAQDDSSSNENLTLVSAYNINEYGVQEKDTDAVMWFDDQGESNYYSSNSSNPIDIRVFVDTVFKPAINERLKNNGGIEISDARIISGTEFLRLMKVYFDESISNFKATGVSPFNTFEEYADWEKHLLSNNGNIFFAPKDLWNNSYWLLDDCWVQMVYTHPDANNQWSSGYVLKSLSMNEYYFGVRPTIEVSKKNLSDANKVETNQIKNATVSLTYNRDVYISGEEVKFTITPNNGYNLASNSVKINGNNINPDSYGVYTFNMPDSAVEITATIETIDYTINYELKEGILETENPTSYNIETKTFTLNNPTKVGHDFIGWSGTDIEGMSNNVTVSKGSTGERTYTANFEPIDITVTYESNGGNSIESTVQKYGTTIVELPMGVKTGYDFEGWYTEEELVNKYEITTLTKDIKLYAKYTPIVYNLEYELDGGTVKNENPQQYTIEDEITLNNPTKNGYKFIGWKTSDDDTVKETYTIEKGNYGDISFIAVYEIEEYTITYELNGGQAENPVTYNILSETFTLNNPTKEGYNFLGWTSPSLMATMNGVTITKGSYGDLEFIATWEKEPEVEDEETDIPTNPDDGKNEETDTPTNPDDGKNEETDTPTNPDDGKNEETDTPTNPDDSKDEEIDTPTNPDEGENDNENNDNSNNNDNKDESNNNINTNTNTNNNINNTSKPSTSSKEETSEEDESEKYTITFNSNGGTKVDSITAAEGEEINAPDEPEKEGYIFAGWWIDEEFTELFNFDKMPSNDMELYAKWQVASISINGITVERLGNETFDEDITFIVKDITEDGKIAEYNKKLSENNTEMLKIFTVDFYKSGKQINSLYSLGIKITIPLEKFKLDVDNYKLVSIKEDGTIEEIESSIEDDKLVFSINELSSYGIVREINETTNYTWLILLLLLIIIVIIIIVYKNKKRKNR